MDTFSSSPLVESFPTSRFSSPALSPTHTETDLPIEVDQSFNSSMSLSGCHDSPSPNLFGSPTHNKGASSFSLKNNDLLSPTPAFGSKPRRPDPVPIQRTSSANIHEKRSLGSGRMFGEELSGNAMFMQRTTGPTMTKAGKGMMLPPAVPEGKGLGQKQRAGIPMQWTSSNEENAPPRLVFQPALTRRETEPIKISPRAANTSRDDFCMDLDSPNPTSRRPSTVPSPAFSGATSYSGSPGLGSFFCESPAAPSVGPTSKRRSLITDSPSSPSASPSAKRASYGLSSRIMEKTASSSAMLFGNAPRPSTIAARRGQNHKRPTLMAIPIGDHSQRTISASSAYPILYNPPSTSSSSSSGSTHLLPNGTFPRSMAAPMRRAFSVCDQPPTPENESSESDFGDSPSMNGVHAEYARRHGKKFVPRVDGSPGFKAMRSSIAVTGEGAGSPVRACEVGTKRKGKVSPYGPGGLPGFGDNEMDGKILPCHKVKEDGLVRITAETLDEMLLGKYDDEVRKYHILDCRFDYEYAGGHIAGAINVKNMDSLDELLLQENAGVHSTGDEMPSPSRSGELGSGEQTVLVFHCEFSAKRAPTFAKHLRARDRTLNGHCYPKIYYPEVYILEGGYSGFFLSKPNRCDPKGYIPMDDPAHSARRNSDLADFRKFSRTKSYTYGEIPQAQPRSTQPPPCPPLAFAAAFAAVGRRHAAVIAEDDEHDSESSPCPRVVSMGGMGLGTGGAVFGSAKPRQLTRIGFSRVASYAGTAVRQ